MVKIEFNGTASEVMEEMRRLVGRQAMEMPPRQTPSEQREVVEQWAQSKSAGCKLADAGPPEVPEAVVPEPEVIADDPPAPEPEVIADEPEVIADEPPTPEPPKPKTPEEKVTQLRALLVGIVDKRIMNAKSIKEYFRLKFGCESAIDLPAEKLDEAIKTANESIATFQPLEKVTALVND